MFSAIRRTPPRCRLVAFLPMIALPLLAWGISPAEGRIKPGAKPPKVGVAEESDPPATSNSTEPDAADKLEPAAPTLTGDASDAEPDTDSDWEVVSGDDALPLDMNLVDDEDDPRTDDEIIAEAEEELKAADEEAEAMEAEEKADDSPADDDEADEKPADEKPKADEAPAEPKKGEDEKQDGHQPPAIPNLLPLQKLIKQLFPVPGRAVPAAPNNGQPAAKPKGNRHPLDSRAAHDSEKERLLKRAQAAVEASDWKTATDALQRLLDPPRAAQPGAKPDEDALFRRADGRWVSIRDEARRLRASIPEPGQKDYRVEYGSKAAQLLADALQRGDLVAVGRVMTNYFQTDAGFDAARRLGGWHLDRGDFALAARCFSALLDVPVPPSNDSGWRMRAAVALRRAGDDESSNRVFESVASGEPRPALGVAAVDPQRWLKSFSGGPVSAAAAISDWLVLNGNPQRVAKAIGGEPLLLSRWSQPLSQSHPLNAQLEMLVDDLRDQGAVPLPTIFPLLVNGKVVYRSLDGVQVVDAATGRPLWKTPEFGRTEVLLTGGLDDPFGGGWGGNVVFRGAMPMFGPAGMSYTNYDGNSAEFHALTNLLFRNANFGTISSDGRQLFVLEDPLIFSQRQPGQFWGWDPNPNQKQSAANQLTAYDLETGRVLWKAGGPSFGEAIELPLAGCFFFGPPVADGGELYVIGEKDDEVRLIALDPRSGKPRWSQLLGYAPAKIEQDIGRRWWPAPIAINQGVLVCPTTIGWLVAVDRVTHDLLWGHRLDTGAPTGPRSEEEQQIAAMVQQAPLAGRWSPSPPMIAGNRVIVTPPESPHLLCLNLLDGKTVWQKPRGEMLFVAGVFDDRVLVVGKKSITAFALADGNSLWTLECPTPAGRGVAVDHHYHLPLASGELWTIDLADGKVTEKLFDQNQHGRLGNLAMYRGLLLSVSPLGVQAFEQREAIQAEIERRKQADPRDPWALLREAEIAALRRDLPSALASLRQIDAAGISADLRERFRMLLVECLVSQVRADPSGHDQEFTELGKLMQSPVERLRFQRLVADRQIARREFTAAFDTYLAMLADSLPLKPEAQAESIAATPSLALQASMSANATARSAGGVPSVWPLVPLRDDRNDIRVRLDLWVAGRLRDLWTQVPEPNRNELDVRVRLLAEQVLSHDPASGGHQPPGFGRLVSRPTGGLMPRARQDLSGLDQFVTLFDFHAASLPVKWKRIEQLAEQRDFVAAEQSLLELRRHADPAIAAEATARLVRLMLEFKLTGEAEQFCDELLRLPEGTRLADGTSAAAFVESLRKSGAIAADASRHARPDWSHAEFSVSRMGANYSNTFTQDLPAVASRLPFFRDHRLQVPHEDQRLDVVDAASERLDWSMPLRSRANAQDGGLVTAEATGHELVILHRGVLHGVSPVDKSVRWSFPLDARGTGQVYYGYQVQTTSPPMQVGLRFSNALAYKQQASQSGSPLAHVTGRYVCCQGRRGLTVYDTVTGQVMWTHDGIRPGTQICGNDEVLYLRTPDQQKSFALRSVDGQAVEMPKLHEWLNTAVHVVGRCFVFADDSQSKGKPALRLFDPLQSKDVWRGVDLPSGSMMSLHGGSHLMLLDPKSGSLRRIDLRTGREEKLGTVEADDLKGRQEVYALADYDRVYLVINGPRQSGAFYSDGLASIRASGKILAFDPQAGRQLWKQVVASQNLLLERFDHVPLLVCAARNHTKIGNHHLWTLNITAIDKRTGAKLLDANAPAQNGFRSLIVNMADRFVELRGYGERVRMQADVKQAAAGG